VNFSERRERSNRNIRMLKKKYRFPIAAVVLLWSVSSPYLALGAENADFDLDITRCKKEIAQVSAERRRLREDLSRDKSEFTSYQERTALRKERYATETDSVRRLIASFERKNDSLDACIGSLDQKKRNFELLKERFGEHIAKACEKLISEAKKYPPAVARPAIGALTFLLNDCTVKNIDNIEALQRLVQAIRNLDESTLSIQTGQEASPVPTIRGNVSILRIGAIFEAIVDEDGKTAAVWRGVEGGLPKWRIFSNGEDAGMIARAIAIRESKSMPAFIPLPLGKEPPKETGK
jgi:hypothetical protein